MRGRIAISGVHFTAASDDLISTGLLGYVSATVNDALRIEGLTLRRTGSGRLTVSYPARTDRHGVEHLFIVPVNDQVRLQVEAQIFAALGHWEGTRRR